MSDLFTIEPKSSLYNYGFDEYGQSPVSFSGRELNLKYGTMYENGVPSNFIQDGDVITRLNVIDGYLQSNNYEEGSAGWRITGDGDIDANSGNFRGDLSAATGTFGNLKLNPSDAPNALIVSDGYNDRVLIGQLVGRF